MPPHQTFKSINPRRFVVAYLLRGATPTEPHTFNVKLAGEWVPMDRFENQPPFETE